MNEKKHRTSINATVWWPATLGLVMKVLMGLLGSWAYWLLLPGGQVRKNADDILSILMQDDQPLVCLLRE